MLTIIMGFIAGLSGSWKGLVAVLVINAVIAVPLAYNAHNWRVELGIARGDLPLSTLAAAIGFSTAMLLAAWAVGALVLMVWKRFRPSKA